MCIPIVGFPLNFFNWWSKGVVSERIGSNDLRMFVYALPFCFKDIILFFHFSFGVRHIRKGMFVEVGKGISPSFQEVLQSLKKNEEYLAFAPDTVETKMMLRMMSIKFPLVEVHITAYLELFLTSNKFLLI